MIYRARRQGDHKTNQFAFLGYLPVLSPVLLQPNEVHQLDDPEHLVAESSSKKAWKVKISLTEDEALFCLLFNLRPMVQKSSNMMR